MSHGMDMKKSGLYILMLLLLTLLLALTTEVASVHAAPAEEGFVSVQPVERDDSEDAKQEEKGNKGDEIGRER